MKTKLFLLLTIIFCATVFGQSFEKLIYSKKDRPTVLINKNIIGNSELMQMIPADKMVKVDVMKPAQKEVDQYSKTFPNLSQYGLISCETTWNDIAAKSQSEIRSFLGVDSNIKIYVDGFLLMNENYLIATKSIQEIDVIQPNETELNTEKIINIWTLTKENRLGNLNIDQAKILKRNIEK